MFVLVMGLTLGLGCTREINLLGFVSRGGSSGAGAGGAAGGIGGAGGMGGDGGKAVGGGAEAGQGGQAGQTADASVGGAPGPVTCTSHGDPQRLATPSGTACSSNLAARTHRFALCSCGDWNVTAPIFTDASSSRPGMVADPNSAALGMNGNLTTASGAADIWARGSLYVGGAKGIVSRGHLDVGRSLRVGGPLVLLAPMASNVWADAYAGGDVSGALFVKGTLHQNPMTMLGPGTSAAATVREPVTVAPPCDCGPTVDVSTSMVNAMAINDNATLGLSLDRLANLKTATTLDLPCGVFALSSIAAEASLTLAVHGRALLAVPGDVVVRGGLTVAIDSGVSLDLLVGGALMTMGSGPVGTTTPAAFRVWVKGAGPIVFDDRPVVGGIIYAPNAALSAPTGMEMYGSALAASLSFGDQATVHFDQGVLTGTCAGPKIDPIP